MDNKEKLSINQALQKLTCFITVIRDIAIKKLGYLSLYLLFYKVFAQMRFDD